jgi:hypothetical protein
MRDPGLIRTVLTPDSKQVTLPIPDEYIGTELEILVFQVKDNIPAKETASPHPRKVPVFGCAKDQFKMSDDFDAPLEDFKEYM